MSPIPYRKDIDGRIIIITGARCRVLCAVRANENSPALKFLTTLQKTERAVVRKFKILFDRICDVGRLESGNFKKEQGNIWAFKYGQYRIACYQAGDAWVLTNGFQKKQNKWPQEVFEQAERIMKADLERINNRHCNKKCKP